MLKWTVATAVGVTGESLLVLGVIFINGMGGGSENNSLDLFNLKSFILAGLILGTLIGFCQKLTLLFMVKLTDLIGG